MVVVVIRDLNTIEQVHIKCIRYDTSGVRITVLIGWSRFKAEQRFLSKGNPYQFLPLFAMEVESHPPFASEILVFRVENRGHQ